MSARLTLAATAAAIVAVVALASFATGAIMGQPPVEPSRDSRNCPLSRALGSSSVMLVDFTDPPTPAHITQLDAGIRDMRRSIPLDGKAIIAALDVSQPDFTSLILEVCNPGTKDGAAFVERVTPAPRDQAWRQRFAMPFEGAIKAARKSPLSKDTSPILEAVSRLTQRADFDDRVSDRRLIVVSDGLQLTPKVFSSFNAGADPWMTYQRSGLPALAQANLKGVKVEFIYLMRSEFAQRQTPTHRRFLKRWFLEHGAAEVKFRGVESDS